MNSPEGERGVIWRAGVGPQGAQIPSRLALAAYPAAAQTADITADPDSLLWGHQFTEWFYAGEVDSLRARLHAAMTARLSRDELLQFREQVAVQPGNETEVLEEAVEPKGLYRTYRREVHMANAGETVPVVFWTINSARRIAGCFIRPKES